MRRWMLLPLSLAATAALIVGAPPSAAAAPPAPAAATNVSTAALTERAAHSRAGQVRSLATSGASSSLHDVYPVGKTTGYTVNRTRGVAARYPAPASSVRKLPISIWYPAVAAKTSSADTFWATARKGHFPLLVFAAGYNASPETYQPFLHALAAQGFIVAAPLFPIEGAIAGAAPAGRSNAEMLSQMYDMSATISQLIAYSKQPGNFLGWAMNPAQIGVIGHSDGAMTVAGMTMSTSYSDVRIKAVAVMSGAGPYGLSWNHRRVVPTLIEQASGDPYNSPSNSQWLFNAVTGPRGYLTVAGPYHIWPLIGNDRTADLTRRAVVAHFTGTLKNGGAGSFLKLVAAGSTPGYTSLRFAS